MTMEADKIGSECNHFTDLLPVPFKGGTTLSNFSGLISRMFEDIDLSISMEFLGEPADKESNSTVNRRVEALRNKNTKFVAGALKSALEEVLATVAEFIIHIDDNKNVYVCSDHNLFRSTVGILYCWILYNSTSSY